MCQYKYISQYTIVNKVETVIFYLILAGWWLNLKKGSLKMGKKYTEGQKNATAKYMADKHTIRVVVTNEKASEYKALAEGSGKSLNQFIIEAIEQYVEATKKEA